MSDIEANKSERATPFKLREAHDRGQVARSTDFNSLVVLAIVVASMYALSSSIIAQFATLERAALSGSQEVQWTPDGVTSWITGLLSHGLQILTPLFCALLVGSIAANLVQTGPVFSVTPLIPDAARIDPSKGFKRIFSLRSVYETAKTLAKLVLLTGVFVAVVWQALPKLGSLASVGTAGYTFTLVDLTEGVFSKLLLVLLLIALIDVAYVRWDFAKRMRMSRREIRDETKQREGDPRIRSRLRELRLAMVKRSRAMRNLPGADVLITNPTHYGVALSYRRGTAGGPKVVAKGAGEMVQKMRQVAGRYGIPVVQHAPLARGLFRESDIDQPIGQQWYPQVAKILVWVFAMRDAKTKARAILR